MTAAGRSLLRGSPEFQRLLGALRAEAGRIAAVSGIVAMDEGQRSRHAGAAAALVIAGCIVSAAVPRASLADDRSAAYVGGRTCASCHAKEYKAWRSSHHALAMQRANERTVLGDFANAKVSYAGITSRFFRQKGNFYVHTDGRGGKLADFPIKYTFGVAPLQQYLIELPGGRLQALGIAWDARSKAAGGQRWFHLYPKERVDFRDVWHWTGPAQNWNHMCAECHSTGVRKNYDADHDRFATSWTDIDVSCEACHGAGSRHVAWANGDRAPGDPAKGFSARLTPGEGRFTFAGGDPIAALDGSRDTRAQIETCGRCHSRRTEISEDWEAGQSLAQTHRVALLDDGLYHTDGQILDEVYEYGSFLQSRMHAHGVACTDCHDPHRGRLRAEGNAVCATCHQPATYDAPTHHHHRQGTNAARCVACHMPSRLFMVIDRRHDHAFRVPRPDLSVALGTPNPCSDCHHDRAPAWAASAIVEWYGPTRSRGPTWARALAIGRRGEVGADTLLRETADQPGVPAIVRATAVELLSRFPAAVRPELVARALRDGDSLVRRAGLGLLFALEPPKRWELGAPLLGDPVRTVRLEAASALADAPRPPTEREAFDRAAGEYRAAQALNADRADAWLNLGLLDARLGDAEGAEAAYRRAIRLEPSFIPPYVNLADLYRAQGRDPDGEAVLREALVHSDAADLHHSLGLLLVRTGRKEDAVGELARAAELAPDVARYAYAYALALDGTGQRPKALSVLADAQGRFTGDREILAALVQLSAEAGDHDAAARWAQKLRALDGGTR